jgi:hypothetical protein
MIGGLPLPFSERQGHVFLAVRGASVSYRALRQVVPPAMHKRLAKKTAGIFRSAAQATDYRGAGFRKPRLVEPSGVKPIHQL